MRLFHKFYDTAAPDAGAAPPVELLTDEIKQELGQLRSLKQAIDSKGPEKTAEQIVKEAELDKANMRLYSVENDLMKDDDFNKFENIKGKKDADLVFEDFSTQWEKDNPSQDPETKAAEIKAAFEAQYHINSDNKTLKERGQRLISQEAAAMRNPLETSYQKAKSGYDESKMIKAELPGFHQFVDDIIKETAAKIVVKTKDGDEEVDIDVDLTEDQRKEIDKTFKNPKTFASYVNNKDKRNEVKAAIAKKITGFIRINNFDRVAQRGYEIGKGKGTKAGSDTGADNSFGAVKHIKTPAVVENTKAVLEQISDSFDKVREKIG